MTKQLSGGLNLGAAQAVAEREDEGRVIEIMDAMGEPLVYMDGDTEKPVWSRVAGSYSKTYRRAVERQRRQALGRRRGRMTSEELTANQIELEAACVLEWGGVIEDDGKVVEHNTENVTSMLAGITWYREQIQIAIEDHAGFFGGA